MGYRGFAVQSIRVYGVDLLEREGEARERERERRERFGAIRTRLRLERGGTGFCLLFLLGF